MQTGDYRGVVAMRNQIESAPRPRPDHLALLGRAHLFCGLYEEGREILSRAQQMRLPADLRRDVEWDLAQIAYQQGDVATALELTLQARSRGIIVHRWYIDLLRSLQGIELNTIEGERTIVTEFRFGAPDLPRLDTIVNGDSMIEGVIDSGAAMSIVSRSIAEQSDIRPLRSDGAVLYGLLGEPIPVTFGMIDTLTIRGMRIRRVPVAIMEDQNLSFFFASNRPFRIDLLIGAEVLKEFRLRFDYSRKQLTMDYLEAEEREPAADQNLFLVDQRPLVQVAINRQAWFPFLLDTGSELTFLNSSKFTMPRVAMGVRGPHNARLQGLGGAQKRGSRVRHISIGVHRWTGRFEHMPLYSDVGSQSLGILGQNYLKNFRVDIDFGRMRVELERNDGGPREVDSGRARD